MGRPWIKVLAGSVALSLLLLAGAAVYVNRAVSAAFERALRERLFSAPGRGFEAAGVRLFPGRAYVLNPRWSSSGPDGSAKWTAFAKEVSAEVPLADLLKGRWRVRRLTVREPSLQWTAGSGAPEPPQGAPEPSAGPGLAALARLPADVLAVERGVVRLVHPGGGALEWENLNLAVALGAPGPLAIHGTARLAGKDAGSVSLDARFDTTGSPCPSRGELRFSALSVPALADFFPPDPDVRYAGGRLGLNAQFTCEGDWLTASHLVEINDFKAEVAEGKKELFGISTKYLKDLYRIERLSFVIPMNGRLDDPQFGVSSSIEQILFKLLEVKTGDKEEARALARKGGDYFGRKLDKSLRRWLAGGKG